MKSLALLLVCSLAACTPKGPAQSTRAVDGTPAERGAAVTKILSRNSPLPGPLQDAHLLQEQTGDGRLGPSDFATFYALTVAPADLPKWRAALAAAKTANEAARYAAPKKAQPWWVTEADFKGLEFFGLKPLTGRVNGWIGLAPDGRIFIHTFTM